MGLCSKCIYHEIVEEEKIYDEKWRREFRSRFPSLPYEFSTKNMCKCPQFVKTDFVTGITVMANCYDKNSFGECLFYVLDETLEDETTDDEDSEDETDDSAEDTDTGTEEPETPEGTDDQE